MRRRVLASPRRQKQRDVSFHSQYNKTIRRPFFEYHLLLVIGGQQVGHDLLRIGQGRLDERFVTVIAVGSWPSMLKRR